MTNFCLLFFIHSIVCHSDPALAGEESQVLIKCSDSLRCDLSATLRVTSTHSDPSIDYIQGDIFRKAIIQLRHSYPPELFKNCNPLCL